MVVFYGEQDDGDELMEEGEEDENGEERDDEPRDAALCDDVK